ncbi:hypothetical protein [Salinimicrobium terrae]|uniref:hypothetical protein n=1 Tax=Salinimicrobium terrae TaxID=470866 RepID=UPI00041AA26D|nr:hypothetical protein [Salinimicrobium terrae]
MKTEKLLINRNEVWISIDSIKLKTEEGLVEQSNQFISYISYSEPEGFIGLPILDENEERKIFSSVEAAREYAINLQRRILYPSNFDDPWEYDSTNVFEILYKPILIDLEDKTIEGTIIRCTSTSNNRNAIGSITVKKLNGAIRSYSIVEIKKFRMPQKN